MISKTKEKELAIKYRKKGFSYNEILKLLPVAKSTLSVWLKDVGLAKAQKQCLTEKRRLAQVKAQQACRDKRIKVSEKIISEAKRKVGYISKRDLWLIGTTLYWAEGAKQKDWNVSQSVKFSNSDPEAINLFLLWLKEICKIPDAEIYFEIYLHETSSAQNARKYWSQKTEYPIRNFNRIIWKRNKISYRKNRNREYHGLLRICIKKSTNFNRKISGWIMGICDNCGVV